MRQYSINKVLRLLKVSIKYTWYVILATILMIIIESVLSGIGFHLPVRDVSASRLVNEKNIFILVLLCIDRVILGPVYEEITFRLALKPSVKKVALALAFFIPILILVPTGFGKFLTENVVYSGAIVYLLLGGVMFFIIYPFLQSRKGIYDWLFQRFNSRAMIYISSLIFAIVHWNRLSGEASHFWLYAVFFLPYFLSGLIFAHARLKEGFAFACMAHAIFNLLLVMLNFWTT